MPTISAGRAAIAPLLHMLPAVVSIGTLFAVWEGYCRLSGVSPSILPAPSRVLDQAMVYRAVLWANTLPTVQATLLGFACSLTAAFAFSVAIDFSTILRRAILPVLVISQTIPLVAIAPLVVLWFGFGLLPKILLVALVTFFPMLVALTDGYDATEPELETLLHSMGASRRTVFRRARMPSALPYFFAGLRISITYAVVAAIFAEYAGAARGLGIFILNAKNSFRPDLVIAAVFVSAGLTLVLFAAAAIVQRTAMPWRRAEASR